VLLSTFEPKKKNHEKKKNRKRKSKIQEDIHEESQEDCPSWWWKTKITSGKAGGLTCTWLTKLAAQFWLTMSSFGENIFI